MSHFEVDYNITFAEGIDTDAENEAEAKQQCEEYIKDIYGFDYVDFQITEVREIN